jgi:glycosyltransferase involved in cell wall biosynthesis
MARVDVVIPCYNYGHFLGACVESVLVQEDVDVSVLVIDDGSADQSVAIAGAIARRDSRVRLIALQKNVGMVPAVNIGISEIAGDYFVKLDADDLLPPGSLKRSISLLEQYPEVGFVYGRPRHFSGAIPPQPRWGRPRWNIWSGPEWFALRCRLGLNCISQPEAVIRRSTLQVVGEYNAKLPHTSDLEMWLRLAAVADVGRINGIDQGYYRVHPDSMQRTVNSGPLTDLLGRREAFLSAFSTVGSRLSNVEQLSATVRCRLAAQALDHACWTYDRDRADPALDDKLIDFALSTYSEAVTLPEWRGLQKRRQRGRRSRWTPGSLLAATRRRGYGELARFRWVRTGI